MNTTERVTDIDFGDLFCVFRSWTLETFCSLSNPVLQFCYPYRSYFLTGHLRYLPNLPFRGRSSLWTRPRLHGDNWSTHWDPFSRFIRLKVNGKVFYSYYGVDVLPVLLWRDVVFRQLLQVQPCVNVFVKYFTLWCV